MKMCWVWRSGGLCLLAAVISPGALVPFLDRDDFKNNTILAPGLPNEVGVNFSTTALCPTTAPTNGNPAGCPGSGLWNEWGSSTNPRTVAFGISGFSVEGYFGGTSNTPRLMLFSANYVHPTRGVDAFNVPFMMSRNLSDNANTSLLKVRINLPANVNRFAIDLSNACNVNITVSGCDYADNHMGTIRVATSAGDSAVVPTVDNTGSGEFTTYAARSDTNITWIELSLPALNQSGNPNVGAIAFTRIAFGEPTPEPSTLLLAAAGLALLLRQKRS